MWPVDRSTSTAVVDGNLTDEVDYFEDTAVETEEKTSQDADNQVPCEESGDVEDVNGIINNDDMSSPNEYDQAISLDDMTGARNDATDESFDDDGEDPQEKMDKLLHSCFMTALKTKLKDKDLPILASTFYRQGASYICGDHVIVKISSKRITHFPDILQGGGELRVF